MRVTIFLTFVLSDIRTPKSGVLLSERLIAPWDVSSACRQGHVARGQFLQVKSASYECYRDMFVSSKAIKGGVAQEITSETGLPSREAFARLARASLRPDLFEGRSSTDGGTTMGRKPIQLISAIMRSSQSVSIQSIIKSPG